MPWVGRLLLALLPVASALLTPSRPLLRTPTMALRRTVGTCCCGGADTDESPASSEESQHFSQPLLPKSGMEGLPPSATTRSRLFSMAEAGPSDSDDGSGGMPVSLYTTLAVLILLATANQWSRAIIFYIVDFSKGAQSQPEQFINVALGFDEASYGLIASLAVCHASNPKASRQGAAQVCYSRVRALPWTVLGALCEHLAPRRRRSRPRRHTRAARRLRRATGRPDPNPNPHANPKPSLTKACYGAARCCSRAKPVPSVSSSARACCSDSRRHH